MGLTYLAIPAKDGTWNTDNARSYFEQARDVPGWADTEGKEVLYLFLGNPHDRSDAPHGDAIPQDVGR